MPVLQGLVVLGLVFGLVGDGLLGVGADPEHLALAARLAGLGRGVDRGIGVEHQAAGQVVDAAEVARIVLGLGFARLQALGVDFGGGGLAASGHGQGGGAEH